MARGIPETHTRKHGTDYSAVWGALNSPVYKVLDEEGNHMAYAYVRHFLGRYWLYCDDVDGYDVVDEDAVDTFHLELDR